MNSTTETEYLVFSSSIRDNEDLERVSDLLNHVPGILDWSVDLDNWENVLRIECVGINAEVVRKILRKKRVYIREMPL